MTQQLIVMYIDRCVSSVFGPQQMEYNKQVKEHIKEWFDDGGDISGKEIPQHVNDILFLTAVRVFGRKSYNVRVIQDIINERD
jgi:hypothetical protein